MTNDKDTSQQLGATVLSQKLAILTSAKEQKTVTHDMMHQQYGRFLQDWNVYKQLTHLPTRDSTHHLYSTCDESVQVSLINTYENFLELSEKEALNAIKSVATVHVNTAVHL